MEDKMQQEKDGGARTPLANASRREALKAGAGIIVGALSADRALAQSAGPEAAPAERTPPVNRADAWDHQEKYYGVTMQTGPGYKNDSKRAFGNGPMDATSRQLVEYTDKFSESNLTPALIDAFHNTMVDTIASLISGFESDPARICARLARTTQSTLKSTVLGYGITTSPELAAYANSSMIRHTDFNDHTSDMMGGILAIGEALHSSGTEVMMAIILAYQIDAALGGAGADKPGFERGFDAGLYYLPATALAVGKLLKLNQDQLANALSLAVTMHIPVRVCRSGVLSMQKGCATADAVRSAVFAALAAREGMTGPAEPFEGKAGVWQQITGPYKQLRLPPRNRVGTALTGGIKRSPAEGWTQIVHEAIIPELRAWTKPDDIESIHIEMAYWGWLEIADPPKWDPLNRETADHSMPYEVARALLDGEVYVDSFTAEKAVDPAVRKLMNKITVSVHPDYTDHGQVRMTVRNKAGAVFTKDTNSRAGDASNFGTPVTHDEIIAKYKRICEFMHVASDQRDRALAQWSNLRAVKDIAEPMNTLAKFGRPSPL